MSLESDTAQAYARLKAAQAEENLVLFRLASPADVGVDIASPGSDKSICWTDPPKPPIPERANIVIDPKTRAATSDGSNADYYRLPAAAGELQDLISYRDMNSQIGEIFRACYRYGQDHHSAKLRDINKIIFYAQAERVRLLKYGGAK